jgi:hypothetical protein
MIRLDLVWRPRVCGTLTGHESDCLGHFADASG